MAQPPLFKIKKGKEVFYAFSDEERNKILGKDLKSVEELVDVEGSEEESEEEDGVDVMEEKAKRQNKISVQRYKGLGEMNSEELWETTMDPVKRVLRQVTIGDAEESNKVFDVLMGTDVPSRKSFIQSNAKLASLDI
jgi:DNA gyrase subunit B